MLQLVADILSKSEVSDDKGLKLYLSDKMKEISGKDYTIDIRVSLAALDGLCCIIASMPDSIPETIMVNFRIVIDKSLSIDIRMK